MNWACYCTLPRGERPEFLVLAHNLALSVQQKVTELHCLGFKSLRYRVQGFRVKGLGCKGLRFRV